jgi:hypothetical protein
MKRSLLTSLLTGGCLFCAVSLFMTCTQKKPDAPGTMVLSGTAQQAITPVPFPAGLGIPGFNFPEDSTVIYGWLKAPAGSPYTYDSASVLRHAWGIWTGLTSPAGQQYNGEDLLVFETWHGINELSAQVGAGNFEFGCNPNKLGRTRLSRPNQFDHGPAFGGRKGAGTQPIDVNVLEFETVAFDPSAACFVTHNKLFLDTVLNKFLAAGAVPPFPSSAITTKPTYFLDQAQNGLIRVPVWPGAPSPADSFGFNIWNNYVYADLSNSQPAGKIPVPTNGSDPASIPAATCNLSDFIYFTLDSAAAAYANQELNINGGNPAQAGDKAILVAMHIATKEISNWVWQTFFWAPDPNNPLWPSSAAAASLRPAQLKGAARHYAAVTTYAMVLPNQPITGGNTAKTRPLIGFNPYLEAGFSGLGNDPNWAPGAKFQYGVQTNCMSCHAMVAYPNPGNYVADRYVDLADPKIFKGQVKLDFSWSILNNVIKTTKTQ